MKINPNKIRLWCKLRGHAFTITEYKLTTGDTVQRLLFNGYTYHDWCEELCWKRAANDDPRNKELKEFIYKGE